MLTVALITLLPGTFEESDPVATPSEPVVPFGCVSVLPLPVALRRTLAPETGAPLPSRTVTVSWTTLFPPRSSLVTQKL